MTHNLCSMVKKDSLKRLTVALLQDICEHFGLDTTGASKKCKAPSIRLIRVEFVAVHFQSDCIMISWARLEG